MHTIDLKLSTCFFAVLVIMSFHADSFGQKTLTNQEVFKRQLETFLISSSFYSEIPDTIRLAVNQPIYLADSDEVIRRYKTIVKHQSAAGLNLNLMLSQRVIWTGSSDLYERLSRLSGSLELEKDSISLGMWSVYHEFSDTLRKSQVQSAQSQFFRFENSFEEELAKSPRKRIIEPLVILTSIVASVSLLFYVRSR